MENSTGRGCVHRCRLLEPSVAEMYPGRTAFTRRKSPERAVEVVAWVKAKYHLKQVHFSEDLFTFQPSWLEAFSELYASRVGVPFTCNSSVELVSERNVEALKNAGCRGVAIGIETGNEELRSHILNKTVSNDDVRQAARRIKNAGMELTTFNMLASPGESLEDAFSTIALNREIQADHVRVALAVPIPFTEWEKSALEEGSLDPATASRESQPEETPGRIQHGTNQAFENPTTLSIGGSLSQGRETGPAPHQKPHLQALTHSDCSLRLKRKSMDWVGWRTALLLACRRSQKAYSQLRHLI